MESRTERQGSSFAYTVTSSNELATSATIYIRGQDTLTAKNATGTFTDGVAVVQFDADPTLVIDTYDVQINLNLSSGGPIKFPKDNCNDCGFLQLKICEALDVETS